MQEDTVTSMRAKGRGRRVSVGALIVLVVVALVIGGVAAVPGYRAVLAHLPADATIMLRTTTPVESEAETLIAEISASWTGWVAIRFQPPSS